jgi:hypothetical protein
MNTRFQEWFSQGKAVEALCGFGAFFVPDVSYREEHDFLLAVGELMEWSRQGHTEDAARAFESALTRLLGTGRVQNALQLLQSYAVLRRENQASLSLNEELLVSLMSRAVREVGEQLSRDERLRNLLLAVSWEFPSFRTAIGLMGRETES